MSKALALTGLILSGLIVIVFLADLAAAFPFRRTSWTLDLAFITAGATVAYLSWSIMDHAPRRRG